MTSELLIMRHAKSAWNTAAASDHERPLAPRGMRALPVMCGWLSDNALEPDRIITSSAVRALTTAQAVQSHFEVPDNRFEIQRSLYGASAAQVVDLLTRQEPGRVMIVGHNPTLDALVELVGAEPAPWRDDGKLMTTAAIAYVVLDGDWSSLARRRGQLRTLVRPRGLSSD